MALSAIYERQFCGKSAQSGINDCFEAGKSRCYMARKEPYRTARRKSNAII